MKYRLLKSFSELLQNVLFHFNAPDIPIVLYPIILEFCIDNLFQYVYIFSKF